MRALLVLGALGTAWLLWIRGGLGAGAQAVRAAVSNLTDDTVIDPDGAVRSVQTADLVVTDAQIAELWSPRHLERLARTYWRFLSRCTLGLIKVQYRDDGRDVVLLGKPLVLLAFHAPEYEMQADRGIVRWRIARGVLVDPRGQNADGYLEIDVTRTPGPPGHARLHVEVEVANFYPAIASKIATWVYQATQSRIHVIVTHGFLRSLARGDLEDSVIGALRSIDDVPNPQPARRVDTASRSVRR